MDDDTPRSGQLVPCKIFLDQLCLAMRNQDRGRVGMWSYLVTSYKKKCLGKKTLQPRKCVFLDVASRAPCNQAHMPICGV